MPQIPVAILDKALSTPFTLDEMIQKTASLVPNKIFLVDEETSLSYSEFLILANGLSVLLVSKDFGYGDRLLIATANNVILPLCLYAASMLGGIVVPVNKLLRGDRLDLVLADCSPKIIITDDESFAAKSIKRNPYLIGNRIDFYNLLSKTSSRQIDKPTVIDLDPILLMYTSGSTGRPKGVALSHSNILSATESTARYLGLSSEDRVLNFNPFHFDYGLYQLFLVASRAATLYIRGNFIFKNELYSMIQSFNITGLPLVPSHINSMYARPSQENIQFPSVRFLSSTGAPFPLKQIQHLSYDFPNAKIFSMYGLTECKRVSYLSPAKLSSKPNSVGKAMPNVRIKVVNDQFVEARPGEVGQLVVEGRNIMSGYWNDPTQTEKIIKLSSCSRRELLTGDYFHTDTDGDLFFHGRKDDLIKTADIRISLKDIEFLLNKISGVRESAVVSLPDEIYENVIIAFVEPFDGSSIDEQFLRSSLRDQVESPYMMPKRIHVVDKLPRIPNGKTDYEALKRAALSA